MTLGLSVHDIWHTVNDSYLLITLLYLMANLFIRALESPLIFGMQNPLFGMYVKLHLPRTA